MAQTLFTQIKGFCTTQNAAPSKALALTLDAMDHMIEHRDWDALAYFLGHAPSNMRTPAKRIVAACLGGVKYDSKSKAAQAHRCRGIFTMGDNFGPTEKMEELRQLVADGEGITSKAVREAFPAPEREKTREELKLAYVKRLKKAIEAAEEDGFKPEDIMPLVFGTAEPNF